MGLEKTPEEYVEKMVKVFREVWRVLRDDGTLWLNMGDSYSSGGRDTYRSGVSDNKGHLIQNDMPRPGTPPDLKSKDLCGVPWRLAFALQADGWYLRSDIIWAKPNPMPESVSGCAWERHRIKVGNNSEGLKKRYETVREHGGATLPGVGHMVPVEWHDCPSCPKCEENDGYILSWNAGRPTKSHEYLFLFTKSPHYYFDAEAVREPHTRNWGNETMNWCTKGNWAEQAGRNDANRTNPPQLNPSGRNIRTVWNIATQPFSEAHFATFPEKLVEPCLKAGTSEKGVCPKCGGPWVRVIEGQGKYAEALQKKTWKSGGLEKGNAKPAGFDRIAIETKTLGWKPSCQCGEERTIPAIVFDPFFGAGTVGVVAQKFNRRFIGLELKPDYCKLAQKRIYAVNVAML